MLNFEIFNEVVLMMQIYITMSFTLSDEIKKSFDFFFIGQCGIYLFVHLSNLFISMFKDCRACCKRQADKCRNKKQDKKLKSKKEDKNSKVKAKMRSFKKKIAGKNKTSKTSSVPHMNEP